MIKSILFGIAIGDALGVPVEFKSRDIIKKNPVKDMRAYGTYDLPTGTFSDDSSLAFCLAEALCHDFDLHRISKNFIDWLYSNYWTPRGVVFDVGIATSIAIKKLANGIKPELAGGQEEKDNGNGSLMRILPLLIYIKDKPIEERFLLTQQVSSLTHGHIRSVIACFYYLEFARQIVEKKDKFLIYKSLQVEISEFLKSKNIHQSELSVFDNLFKKSIVNFNENDIFSSGYVIHTLEASIWCILTTNSYQEAVLKAVNLGSDTDTTGAVTGGLAGLLYGFDTIPSLWLLQMARKNDIEDLALRLEKKYRIV